MTTNKFKAAIAWVNPDKEKKAAKLSMERGVSSRPKANPEELLPPPTDRRKKPRLRVLQSGECQYPFAPGSWMIFPNPQAAYRHLRIQAKA